MLAGQGEHLTCTSRERPSMFMRRSSACKLGGGGWDSVTKKESSSDHSRRCSTPCHLLRARVRVRVRVRVRG